MMCKISHKLNTDTFQIIDPILACVTSYDQLRLISFSQESDVAQGKVPSYNIKYDKHYYIHGRINDTLKKELWITYRLYGKVYIQAVWTETC